jgi:transposase
MLGLQCRTIGSAERENGKGEINHIRYKEEVIRPLVIPFMQKLNENQAPDSQFKFQQDNAPSHNSEWMLQLLQKAGIQLHEHPGNSPDMNAIEKAWMPMRILITNVWNRPHTLEWTARAWYAEWEALSQDDIRTWVHSMIETNERILLDEEGNHFHG